MLKLSPTPLCLLVPSLSSLKAKDNTRFAWTNHCRIDRLTPQLRIVALLHGRIKRVHVHVYDFPSHHPNLFYSFESILLFRTRREISLSFFLEASRRVARRGCNSSA